MSKKTTPKTNNETIDDENIVSEQTETAEAEQDDSKTATDGNETCEKSTEEQKQEQEQEQEDANTRYMRLMADFQNYKKRVEKEKNDIYSFANEKIVTELLDVMDNFERALGADIDESENEGFVKGMNMIFKQLKAVLEKSGVKEIEALGFDFDPNFHNAVMTEDSAEYDSGKVTAVLQKGYMLNNKVVRPSMVKVAN